MFFFGIFWEFEVKTEFGSFFGNKSYKFWCDFVNFPSLAIVALESTGFWSKFPLIYIEQLITRYSKKKFLILHRYQVDFAELLLIY